VIVESCSSSRKPDFCLVCPRRRPWSNQQSDVQQRRDAGTEEHAVDAAVGPVKNERPSPEKVIYRETTVAADAVLDELELETPAVVQWWIKHRHTTVERLLVHMIAESHRHAGHLDIVREQLDGFIGLRPAAPNIPDLTPGQWEEQRQGIKALADGA
jgi:hypothetical protein